ncbi:hypothetical protein HJG60_011493 [Phyllostomus discolor]|uniref:Uncharacterized protein n=1 Tax=Phyllostomus discolor TaxID=89673 RepID=A0A833ZY42_9CHIR|nr:hypothetical protein HJG60_011493 [Phyllostomus discolor]
MDYQVLWRKKDSMASLSRGEKGLALAMTSLYFFWGAHYMIVLIYSAQVHFRWLPFTENEGEDATNYITEEAYLQMKREKWLNQLHSILRRFSTDFRKLQYALAASIQDEGVLAEASLKAA